MSRTLHSNLNGVQPLYCSSCIIWIINKFASFKTYFQIFGLYILKNHLLVTQFSLGFQFFVIYCPWRHLWLPMLTALRNISCAICLICGTYCSKTTSYSNRSNIIDKRWYNRIIKSSFCVCHMSSPPKIHMYSRIIYQYSIVYFPIIF